MTRATLTAKIGKMALTAKMRDCSRFMVWITLIGRRLVPQKMAIKRFSLHTSLN